VASSLSRSLSRLQADAMMTVLQATGEARIPYIGTGGRVDTIPEGLSLDYAWHVSFKNGDSGLALADYIHDTIGGPVWAIGPDFVGGYTWVNGFVGAYTAQGGELANPSGQPTWTPYPDTTNFIPYLNQILASDAKAVFCFFAGANAIAFIKQYAQVIGVDRIPLYVAGPAIEGNALLAAIGTDAQGVYSSFNYASDLDNPANRAFASAYQAEYGQTAAEPNMLGWDAPRCWIWPSPPPAPNPTLSRSTRPSPGSARSPARAGTGGSAPTTPRPNRGTCARSAPTDVAFPTSSSRPSPSSAATSPREHSSDHSRHTHRRGHACGVHLRRQCWRPRGPAASARSRSGTDSHPSAVRDRVLGWRSYDADTLVSAGPPLRHLCRLIRILTPSSDR
jgi:hypothetical protein